MMKIIDFDSEDIVIGSNTTKPTIYLGYDSKSEHYISIEPLKSNPTYITQEHLIQMLGLGSTMLLTMLTDFTSDEF